MTHDDFNKLLLDRTNKTVNVLECKSKEYATSRDKLHNFKRSAAITGETPAQVCVGFFVKHMTSILDLVDAEARGGQPTVAVLDEKIGDAINYLILLEAILVEGITNVSP